MREQNALSDEIVGAMNDVNIGNAVDEADLEDELEALQQEALDEQMLKTGSVPVSDAVQRLPAAANGERKTLHRLDVLPSGRRNADDSIPVPSKNTPVAEEDDEEAELQKAAGRDGDVGRCPAPTSTDESRTKRLGRRPGGMVWTSRLE